MISVVFLLLIFFLMTVATAPPAPMNVVLPRSNAAAERSGAVDALYFSSDGTLAYGTATGGEAIRLTAASGVTVDLRADGGVAAAEFVALLSRLADAGVGEARLITVKP